MIVGVDIGGHHVAAALVDPATHRLFPGSYRHREVSPDADAATLIAAWSAAIDDTIDGAAPDEIEGIGVAMPGPFDYQSGVGYFAANAKFRSLHGVDIGDAIATSARHPRPIRFLNDATSFAVGCVAMRAAPSSDRVLGITLGTGLGSAFLEDGAPIIDRADVPPHGCLWHLPYRDGIADDYVSARWILGEARTRLDRQFDGVAAVADMARANGGEAATIFADYGANLAAIVAPWVDRFDVGTIMLGGRICGAFDLFRTALIAGLATTPRIPVIAIHQNTEGAAIIGAAATFEPHFWDRAKHRLPTR
ncbi:MAG: ROK family protein [Sphingomonas sp.]|uniref:ROK family protein n=1 Tax=Sphingomonas sp. TaxID=28214 RepID=UPI003F7F80B6